MRERLNLIADYKPQFTARNGSVAFVRAEGMTER